MVRLRIAQAGNRKVVTVRLASDAKPRTEHRGQRSVKHVDDGTAKVRGSGVRISRRSTRSRRVQMSPDKFRDKKMHESARTMPSYVRGKLLHQVFVAVRREGLSLRIDCIDDVQRPKATEPNSLRINVVVNEHVVTQAWAG